MKSVGPGGVLSSPHLDLPMTLVLNDIFLDWDIQCYVLQRSGGKVSTRWVTFSLRHRPTESTLRLYLTLARNMVDLPWTSEPSLAATEIVSSSPALVDLSSPPYEIFRSVRITHAGSSSYIILTFCPNFAQTLPKHCPNFAWTLPELCPNFAQTLLEHCPNFAQTLPELCPNIARTLPKHCLNFARTLPELCPNFARTLPKLCPNFARTLPELCPNFARTLPEHCPNIARTLPELCPNFAQTLPELCPNPEWKIT